MASGVFRLFKIAAPVALAVMLVPSMSVWANPPETVNVHGSLVDSGGSPLTGLRGWQIRFFDAETDGAQLGGDLTGMVEVSPDGLFNLPVALPAEALAAAEVWYELGIDTDSPPDGNAADDLFPGRIRVYSVPFALEAGTVQQLDADRIGGGTVDNTEFDRLNGVTQPIQTSLDAKADGTALTAHTGDVSNPHAVTKAQVGLDNVDNTSDMVKPVSTATQTALNAKANTTTLTAHTGNVANPHAVTKVQVGLGNVDNTSDMAKPVSTSTQTALNAKADVATVTAHTSNVSNPHAVTKAQVGLVNVDNTSDMDKPISSEAQAALNTKAESADLAAHAGDAANPHAVTKEQVGLGDADNTADVDKPVSTAVQAALDGKLSKISESCIIVNVTSDSVVNGENLRAAYEAATALLPYSTLLGPTNRVVVLVPPGKYNLSSEALTMDKDYVDLVGLSTARDNQYLYSDNYVLIQTARDVHIENLVLHYTAWSNSIFAYAPGVNWDDGGNHLGSPPATVIRNCVFRASQASMRDGVEYAGTYENCVAEGSYTFGGNASGVASGTFVNCTGGIYAFGSAGIASGMFINCTGGIGSFGCDGTASGTFIGCTGGDNAFGLVASGTFTNCIGGDNAFGSAGSAPDGKFYHCIGGANSFSTVGTPAPTHLYCIRDNAVWP